MPEVVGKSHHLPQQSLGGVVTKLLGVPGQGSSSLSLAATDGVPVGAVAPSQPAGPPCPESAAGRRFCCSPGHLLLRAPVSVIFPAFPSICSASAAPGANVCTAATLSAYFSRMTALLSLHPRSTVGLPGAAALRAAAELLRGVFFFFPFTPAEDGACLASASTLKDARFKVFFCGRMDRTMLSDALSVLGDFSNGASGCWFGASPPDVGRRYRAASLGCHP